MTGRLSSHNLAHRRLASWCPQPSHILHCRL